MFETEPPPANLFTPPPRPRPSEYVYYDVAPVHRNAGPAETDAAIAATAFVKRLRVQVLAMVRAEGAAGLTVKELTRKFRQPTTDDVGSLRNTVGPRLSELKHGGLVHLDSKIRREGCGAYVAVAGRDDEDGAVLLRAPAAAPKWGE
jgi:hypothetical protein